MVIDLEFFMNLAINEAWKYQGLTYPNPAVGCVIVGENYEILSVEAHKKAGEPHAEVNALQSAFYKLTNKSEILSLTSSFELHEYLLKNHNQIFSTCRAFVTLEPCNHIGKTPSCASLLKELNLKEIYIATKDKNEIASDGASKLKNVHFGLCESDALKLLEPFMLWQNSRFVFFKWAMRLDGTIDGGIISSQSSRVNVHQMRGVCDLLIIGGNTVRIDRPTLDARLVDGKAPDVLIYSKTQEFDRDIALFKVPGRNVFISDKFDIIENYKNIMIEGGAGMFEATKEFVDLYLAYQALTGSAGGSSFSKSPNMFELLNISHDEDIKFWLKRIENV